MTKTRGVGGTGRARHGRRSGNGTSHSRPLAEERVTVCVNDINADGARRVAEEIGGFAVPFDVSDRETVRENVAVCERECGPVDLLVANHAYHDNVAVPGAHRTGIQPDLRGESARYSVADRGMHACDGAARLRPDRGDRIGVGHHRLAERHGVHGEQGGDHRTRQERWLESSCATAIAVNAIGPGITDTPQLDVDALDAGLTHEEMVDVYAKDVPLGRIGRPEDIAATVAFLLSTPAIAFVGHVIGPNGGSTRA